MADPIRAIPDVLTGDRNLAELLEAIKEIVEVREGTRGDYGDRFVSYDEMVELLREGASDHRYLSGIQGGAPGEYFHLSADEYAELNAWLDNVTLLGNGGIVADAPASFSQLTLTPRASPVSSEKGAMYFDSDDSCVYVCTET